MSLLAVPAFDTADAQSLLQALDDSALDALDYGVVEMDRQYTVLRYNATESRYSGLSPERVVGRHFFREVAPCTDNRLVARRFALAMLDDTIAYTFSLRMKPTPVTLRMLADPGSERLYLLVRWD